MSARRQSPDQWTQRQIRGHGRDCGRQSAGRAAGIARAAAAVCLSISARRPGTGRAVFRRRKCPAAAAIFLSRTASVACPGIVDFGNSGVRGKAGNRSASVLSRRRGAPIARALARTGTNAQTNRCLSRCGDRPPDRRSVVGGQRARTARRRASSVGAGSGHGLSPSHRSNRLRDRCSDDPRVAADLAGLRTHALVGRPGPGCLCGWRHR